MNGKLDMRNYQRFLDQNNRIIPKVYNITFPGLYINSELNGIVTDLDIKQVGKITKARKNILLVETTSAS